MPGNPTARRLLPHLGRMSPERRSEIVSDIESSARPTKSFFALVLISTVIAAYGLLSDSTAVVIGAMLLAPLMGPILGVALALVSGDTKLLRRSAVCEAAGVTLAMCVGIAIGLMPLRADYGSEILGRTQPTLYDIVIAASAFRPRAGQMQAERSCCSRPTSSQSSWLRA